MEQNEYMFAIQHHMMLHDGVMFQKCRKLGQSKRHENIVKEEQYQNFLQIL